MELGARVVITQFGEDPMDAVERHLVIEEQAAPDPRSLRPTDVVVRVRAAHVAWVDLLMTSGQYQHMPQPPYVPGLEYSGEVAWVGAEVTRAKIGDRVIPDGLFTGPRSKGDYQKWGGFATWAVAPESALTPLPKELGFDQGASFFGSYETAYHCLVQRGRLRAGEWVIIHGASGSSGLAAVEVAKAIGARVIATGRSPSKLDVVRARGAEHVVRVTDDEGKPRAFRDDVKAITEGRGADVVYDAVGGETSIETLRCVAFGARFLIVGWASTPDVARGRGQRGAPNANVLPTNLILMKGLDVLGAPMALSTHRDPSTRAERTRALLSWLEQGKLAPLVSATYPLREVRDAMRAKWKSEHAGSVVLHP